MTNFGHYEGATQSLRCCNLQQRPAEPEQLHSLIVWLLPLQYLDRIFLFVKNYIYVFPLQSRTRCPRCPTGGTTPPWPWVTRESSSSRSSTSSTPSTDRSAAVIYLSAVSRHSSSRPDDEYFTGDTRGLVLKISPSP